MRVYSKAVISIYFSKSVFLKISQFYRKAPVLEFLFSKVTDLKASNFIK